MRISRLGIDLAKEVFELCGVDERGAVVLRKTLRRRNVLEFVSQLARTEISMEACGGSHYWARKFQAMGHSVRIVPAQYVKPFVKSQKNDRNDALAICEASSRPTMNFVSPKQIWQQDIQSIHRIRSRLISQTTELRNQMRGLLLEYGISIGVGIGSFRKSVLVELESAENELTDQMRAVMRDVFEEYCELERRKKTYDDRIKQIARGNDLCVRLAGVPGVGPLTSTMFVAHIGNPKLYKNGRQAAAALGLVPRQKSTGGKTILQGITKRGDVYLRSLFVHGARSAVLRASKISDESASRYQLKIKSLLKTKHMNTVVVAVANRNVRVMLTMLKTGESYMAA